MNDHGKNEADPEKKNQDGKVNLKSALIVGGILVLIAVVFLFALIDQKQKYDAQERAARYYLPVDAKILSSKVVKHTSNNSNKTSTSWHPDIRYRYTVDGKTYKSRRYNYSYKLENFFGSAAKAAIQKYPAGASVIAYYHPKRPHISILDKSMPDMTFAYIFIGLFSSIYGFILFAFIRFLLLPSLR